MYILCMYVCMYERIVGSNLDKLNVDISTCSNKPERFVGMHEC